MIKPYHQPSQKTIVPVLREKEISVGVLLGQGAFSTIREATKEPQEFERTLSQTTDLKYAVKQLRKDLGSNKHRYAFKDLQNEARVLSTLVHPNIIQIYGIGEIDDDTHAFILMEKLSCTSEAKWDDWQELHKEIKSHFIYKKRRKATLWNERLNVAKDFASAMAYLHDMNIIHRDLKLGNCGFDATGKFKLFDFGLAASLTQDKRIASNQYKLTGFTGTRRYMAPEVFKCSPYGKPADVYSFCLVIWEFMSLKAAFIDESEETLRNNVHGEMNYRPIIKSTWPRMFQQLIRECWSADPSIRPSFDHIQAVLQKSRV